MPILTVALGDGWFLRASVVPDPTAGAAQRSAPRPTPQVLKFNVFHAQPLQHAEIDVAEAQVLLAMLAAQRAIASAAPEANATPAADAPADGGTS